MLSDVMNRIEGWLWERGLKRSEVRRLVAVQIVFAALSSIAVMLGSFFSGWSLHYGAVAILMTVNFYHLAKFAQGIVHVRRGAVLALLLRFYGRLILSGFVLFALIWFGRASAVALLAGASTVVVSSMIWACSHYMGHKAKEA